MFDHKSEREEKSELGYHSNGEVDYFLSKASSVGRHVHIAHLYDDYDDDV